MTNYLQYQISEEEIDENNQISNYRVINYTFEYDQGVTYTASLPNLDSFISFPFGTITAGKFIRINTDQTITVKMNGGSEILTVTSNLLINGTFTEIVIKNTSGHTATVTFEVYGT